MRQRTRGRARVDASAHAELTAVAAGQLGAFRPDQALSAGWSKAAVDAATRSGQWRRLCRGSYVDAGLWEELNASSRHLCHANGRLLVLQSGWHLARRTAALAYGLPMLGKPPVIPQLLRAPTTAAERATSRHERLAALPEAERGLLGGVAVTSMSRVVVDLARTDSMRSAVVTADAALRCGMPAGDLERSAARVAGWSGSAQVGRVVAFANGLSESPLESISRFAMTECDLPQPELQVAVWAEGEFVARVDYLWRESRTVGEADGRSKYTSVDDLYAEKRREERLRDLGFEVVRWDWARALAGGPEFATPILRAQERGARGELSPVVRLVPTTVSELRVFSNRAA